MWIFNKTNIVPNTYYINNHLIKEVTHAKYLGVIIDQNLSWNEYIKQISSKATKVNAFLHCNLYHCPVNTKLNCYKAMVRPVLEYASPVWDPHTAINIKLLESVQRSAARLCYKDYSSFSSVTTMLENLNFPTLKLKEAELNYKWCTKLLITWSVYPMIVWFRLPLSYELQNGQIFSIYNQTMELNPPLHY